MVRCLPWIAAALVAAPILAQTPGSLPALIAASDAAAPEATEFRQLRVAGRDVYRSVGDVVKSMTWYSRLGEARAAAAAGHKPIVWIHALGDLKGYT